jgi:hypothetical protein
MAVVNHYLSIVTLNVNGLNSPIIRHRVADRKNKTKQNKKTRSNYMLPKQTHFSFKDTYRLKVKRWKNIPSSLLVVIFHVNSNKREGGIFIYEKTDFKLKTITRDKGYFMMSRDQFIKKHNNCKYICIQHWST